MAMSSFSRASMGLRMHNRQQIVHHAADPTAHERRASDQPGLTYGTPHEQAWAAQQQHARQLAQATNERNTIPQSPPIMQSAEPHERGLLYSNSTVKCRLDHLFHETTKAEFYTGEYLGGIQREPAIIKVARSFEDSDILSCEDEHFRMIKSYCHELLELSKDDASKNPHFERGFAWRLDSFMAPALDDARVNVLTLNQTNFDNLVKLSDLRQYEVDTYTNAQLFRRVLQLYYFYDLQADYTDSPLRDYPRFSDTDYLLDVAEQRLIYYNYSGPARDVTSNYLVRAVAKYFLDWTPFDADSPNYHVYQHQLQHLADVGHGSLHWAISDLCESSAPIPTEKRPFIYRDPKTKLRYALEA